MALSVGKATAETDVSSDTQRKQASTIYTETIYNQKKDAGQRVTLIEKLVSSQKSPGRNSMVPMSTIDECLSKMENADRTENASLDRVGRRLQKMLEAVKTAKNIAKPVQQALAEALDAFKHTKAARTEQQEARACWVSKMTEDQAKSEASRSPDVEPKNSSNIDYTLFDISQELKALRKEVGDIRSTQGNSSSTEDGGTWSEVVKKKPTTKKPRTDQGTGDTGNDVRLVKNVIDSTRLPKKRPPAIIVRVKDGTYSETLKKLKGSSQVKAFSEDVTGLTKARDGDLLIRMNSKTESSSQLMEAIGTAIGDRTAIKELPI